MVVNMNDTKVMLGQINPTPCDWMGNMSQIQDGIVLASQKQCHLAAFPEMSIPGYLCQDKMYDPDFVPMNLRCLQDLIEFSKAVGPGKPYIVVGYVDRNHAGQGKPLRNMAAVIRDGILIGTYQKQLLPYYDVFDEGRYFEPGNTPFVWNMNGERWGLLICEDWWNDKEQEEHKHKSNPVQQLKDLDVKRFLTINSSPFCRGKLAKRLAMAKSIGTHNHTFIFVNQQGGMDELVFDGLSFIVHSGGLSHICDKLNSPCYEMYEIVGSSYPNTMYNYEPDPTTLDYEILKMGLRDYVHKSGFKEVVVGSSGGIDSAVVLSLACDALGPENVHGVRMPSIYSTEDDTGDALQLHKNLGCHDHLVPISHMPFIEHVNKYVSVKGHYDPVADQNIQPRLRANVLMHLSNAYGWLVLCTGNKTELATGYFTVGGDAIGGLSPIKDLYKTNVYQLALRDKRIPKSIIDKKPSARLAPDQFDESSLLPYPILDEIVKLYCESHITTFEQFRRNIWQRDNPHRESWEKNKPKEDEPHAMVVKWIGENPVAEYDRILTLIERNEFKRRVPTGIKLTKVAFGSGRRIPIVKGKH